MSRTGVSQSWMVELQTSVAHIRNHPARKQAQTSTGTESVTAQTKLATISALQHIRRPIRLEKRNLRRNMTAKLMDMPTSIAYPAMSMSSCIRPVVPTMSEAAAR